MPTLIDELVVSLALDARKFKEGTAQAEVATREIGRRTEAGLGAVRLSAEKYADSITTVLDGLARGPVQALYVALTRLVIPALKNAAAASVAATAGGATSATRTAAAAAVAGRAVANTGAQATRTGAAVAAGARAGTLGFEALAVAAVGAGVAIYAVDKALKTAYESATKTYGASLGAAAAGLPVETFSAIQNALAPAPPEEVGAALEAQQQFLNQLSQGHPDQARIQALALAAPGVRFDVSSQELLHQLAINFKKLADQGRLDLAITQGANLGISPAVVKQLAELGARFPAAVAAAPHITPADVKAAEDYLKATARLSQAWEQLTRDIVTRLEPALETILSGIKGLVDSFDNLGAAFRGIASADIHDIMVIFDALKDLLSGHPIQAWEDLKKLNPVFVPKEGATAQIPPAGAGTGAPIGTPGAYGSNQGMLKASVFGNSADRTFTDSSERPYQLQAGGLPVEGNPGIALPIPKSSPNFGQWYDVTAPNGMTLRLRQTDFGPAQWTGRQIDINAEAAKQYGYTQKNFPTNSLFNVVPVGPGPRAPLPAQPLIPPITPQSVGPQSMLNSPSYQAQLAMVRGAQSSNQIAMAGGGDTTHTMTNTVGDITVNTAATDAKSTVAELRDAIRRNLLIDTQNGAFAA
jgi:hypothetical protein